MHMKRPVRKVILRNALSPGDIIMLTAALRDLHMSNPGDFLTDVRTSCAALWEHNPYVTRLDESDPGVEQVRCEYPLIHQSNQLPYHMIHGFRLHMQDTLGVTIEPHAFKGDIHLSADERRWMSQIEESHGLGTRFWIIASGGKRDFTCKWWDPDRAQRVVDHFRGRILFVQCGEGGHHHPRLHGAVDLVGRTSLRQMVRLMYHADGVVCPVTMFMHLAAAVETKPGRPRRRPCVVIAGGREPAQWEAYPHHQFLHTNGALPCCDNGGCWLSRVVPLFDGDAKDRSLCKRPVRLTSGLTLPECMDMIQARDVIEAIERYLRHEAAVDPGPTPAPVVHSSTGCPAFDGGGLVRIPARAGHPTRARARSAAFPTHPSATDPERVTCRQMERWVRLLAAAKDQHRIPAADADLLQSRLVAADAAGVLWAPGMRTAGWYRWDGARWLPGRPPVDLHIARDVALTFEALGDGHSFGSAGSAADSTACAACGQPLRPDHRFCGSCGVSAR